VNIQIAGENALIIYFDEKSPSKDSLSHAIRSKDSANISIKVQQAYQLIQKHFMKPSSDRECVIRGSHSGLVIDLVPSYASILVVFDMFKCDHHQLRQRLRACFAESVLAALNEDSNTRLKGVLNTDKPIITNSVIELPAYYAEEVGADLARIAKQANLSIAEVIDIHQASEYQVYAIGFAPGFAYLGDVDKRIAMPRLSSPRAKVPQGAIAIADRQTAVYPSQSPGGWNIIGSCPLRMFNPDVDPMMPVKVGDKVKFIPIDKATFLSMGGML
jgi:KipI family sensor histidine kinase inhibitor